MNERARRLAILESLKLAKEDCMLLRDDWLAYLVELPIVQLTERLAEEDLDGDKRKD